ncbi:cysteine desulfurase family protein [Mesorhizobium sp. M4B.F.Ca.ET.017.02.2.1]|uniref:cysteine desulfurase family protein n=1 Tax=Mesorhizobium sp. M4B.F.Ca.ET.017.02.2.1 TaxID=2496649 RepID=UPI001675A234|nr:cysteine desulfurase family protein [Mesorhizobium sp. M4B.F.Ca.ET.017.02.2.1]
MNQIYLDGHSTTPLAPEALEAMTPWWHAQTGNPHSPHFRGMLASQAVESARAELAELISADSQELVFTSGATEANNIAIRGTAFAALESGFDRRRIIVSAIEHKSVLASAASLKGLGFQVVEAPVTRQGLVDLERLAGLIDDQTLMVSVMAVNNEVGSIQPIARVVELARAAGALVHVDAAQAVGKLPLGFTDFDLASISSHKVYGPMGIGALFISSASSLRPLPVQFGGGQESGLRPGTVPTPLVVGFGVAARVARERLIVDCAHAAGLAASLLDELRLLQTKFLENVPETIRVPGSISIRFPGQNAMSIIGRAGHRLAISEGSACNSGQINESHVLSAMGYTTQEASETVRIYCSRFNTQHEVIEAARILSESIRD